MAEEPPSAGQRFGHWTRISLTLYLGNDDTENWSWMGDTRGDMGGARSRRIQGTGHRVSSYSGPARPSLR